MADVQNDNVDRRICPILSLVSLSRPDNVVKLAGGNVKQGPAATRCAGAECMWWVPIADAQQRIVGGQCAVALVPNGLTQVAGQIAGAKHNG